MIPHSQYTDTLTIRLRNVLLMPSARLTAIRFPIFKSWVWQTKVRTPRSTMTLKSCWYMWDVNISNFNKYSLDNIFLVQMWFYLTSHSSFPLQLYFENNIEREKYSGHLYGLGPSAANANSNTVSNGAPYGEHFDPAGDNAAQVSGWFFFLPQGGGVSFLFYHYFFLNV